jgi:hypothetical protein
MPMRIQGIVVAALVLVGGALLAVPGGSEGDVLVPISPGHGLSAVDLAGAVLVAAGVSWLEVILIRRLPALRLGARTLFGLGLVAGLGLGLLIASVFTGFWWWAVGAGLFTLILATLTVRSGLVPARTR